MLEAATLQIVIKLVYAGALCYGCISDIRGFTIPNAVSLTLVVLFVLNYWLMPVSGALPEHAVSACAAFTVTFALYAAGLMGAGDVKLISALMLWGGYTEGLKFLLIMSLVGGLVAGILLILRKAMKLWPFVQAYIPSSRVKAWARLGILPYGIAICIAGLISMPSFFAAARHHAGGAGFEEREVRANWGCSDLAPEFVCRSHRCARA